MTLDPKGLEAAIKAYRFDGLTQASERPISDAALERAIIAYLSTALVSHEPLSHDTQAGLRSMGEPQRAGRPSLEHAWDIVNDFTGDREELAHDIALAFDVIASMSAPPPPVQQGEAMEVEPPSEKRRTSFTLNLSDEEIVALEALAKQNDMSKPGVFRLALRHYQAWRNPVDLGPLMDPALAPPVQQGEAAAWVSPEQLASHKDPLDPDHLGGDYLPVRKSRAGKFTQPLYLAPSLREEGLREAVVAGWNACRKSVYALCEDITEKPFAGGGPLRGLGPTPTQEAHSEGFNAGWKHAGKSVARTFCSMEAMDDDNAIAALRALSHADGGGNG